MIASQVTLPEAAASAAAAAAAALLLFPWLPEVELPDVTMSRLRSCCEVPLLLPPRLPIFCRKTGMKYKAWLGLVASNIA